MLPLTIESRRAIATEGGERVPACAAVEARVVGALVHVRLAVLAGEPVGAAAPVVVDLVGADAAVEAGPARALVLVGFAVGAGVAYNERERVVKATAAISYASVSVSVSINRRSARISSSGVLDAPLKIFLFR